MATKPGICPQLMSKTYCAVKDDNMCEEAKDKRIPCVFVRTATQSNASVSLLMGLYTQFPEQAAHAEEILQMLKDELDLRWPDRDVTWEGNFE